MLVFTLYVLVLPNVSYISCNLVTKCTCLCVVLTIIQTWQLIQEGDYTSFFNLKDVYLHIPLVMNNHNFLLFVWQDKPYEWKVLPVGLATAPLDFTSITKTMSFLC